VHEFVALSKTVTDTYFSNEVVAKFMYGLGSEFSDTVSVFKIGDSVNGAPLLAMDISTSAGELYASKDLSSVFVDNNDSLAMRWQYARTRQMLSFMVTRLCGAVPDQQVCFVVTTNRTSCG
jgi:hypothetical protein